MAIREILKMGDERLLRVAQPVTQFNTPTLQALLQDLNDTMLAANGAGLAAPQIGLDQRISVIEWPEDPDKPEETLQRYEVINPEIVKAKGAEEGQEGCLSLPGLAADVVRATFVLVKFQDRNGKEVRLKVYDWLARIFQHEIDHLNGVLMTDRAETLYRIVENEDGEVELIPLERVAA